MFFSPWLKKVDNKIKNQYPVAERPFLNSKRNSSATHKKQQNNSHIFNHLL